MAGEPPQGATPLDPDETEGLLPWHIVTHGELDELEEANIQVGLKWALNVAVFRRNRRDILTETFIYELHRRMFGEIWQWAGEVRRTDKNIGVDKFVIRQEVRKLVDDARVWREQTLYDPDGLAVRFHHRLVWIHPFSNGNGRHARMMADLIARQAGRLPFSWGSVSPTTTAALRTAYIDALRAADRSDIEPLLRFARS